MTEYHHLRHFPLESFKPVKAQTDSCGGFVLNSVKCPVSQGEETQGYKAMIGTACLPGDVGVKTKSSSF